MLPTGKSECSSRTKAKLLEYKKCRVSAARDFPLGCGQFAHLSNLNANGTENISDIKNRPRSVDAVRDFPHSCGWNASLAARKFNKEYKPLSSKTSKENERKTGLGNKVQPHIEKKIGEQSLKKNDHVPVKAVCQGTGQLGTGKIRSSQHVEKEHNLHVPKSRSTDGFPSSFGYSSSSRKRHDNGTSERNKVKDLLHLFRAECDKLLQEEESKRSRGVGTSHRRVDLESFKILKDRGILGQSGKHVIGDVPGVKVGDKFHYRVELMLIGLHNQIQSGIAYGNFGGTVLATSVVASGGYADDLHGKDSLVYTGHGGNANPNDPQDQKLERGNLALKNSVKKNPVRVIRGSELLNGSRTYFYDGLYSVEKCVQERGALGKLVFKFQMKRIGGIGN